MNHIKNYLSLIKFSHTIFAMPFALIGYFIAYEKFEIGYGQWNLNKTVNNQWFHDFLLDLQTKPLLKLVLVILCMVFARSAAMAFNRYLDRKWDALNPRTAIREIPKGIITPKNALAFTI